MTKVIVETCGSYSLVDMATKTTIEHDRCCVAIDNHFIQMNMGLKKLKIRANNLSDDATDKELVEYLEDSGEDKIELAIESFANKYSLDKSDEDKELDRLMAVEAAEAAEKEAAEAAEKAVAEAAEAAEAAEKEAAEKARKEAAKKGK